MKTRVTRSFSSALLIAGLFALGGTAEAITSYSLNQANIAGTAPFGNVTVTLTDSTHANIAFTALTTAGVHYYFGAQGALALNVNGAVTVGPFTGSGGPANAGTGATLSLAAPGNEDGFGSFNFTVDNDDGFPSSLTTAS